MKAYLFLCLLVASCAKPGHFSDDAFFYRDNPIPQQVLTNYYDFPSTDTFCVYGIARTAFRFLYREANPVILQQELYLTEEYQTKMMILARKACQQLLWNVTDQGDFLYNYQLAIVIGNVQVNEKPELSWRLHQVKL